MIQRRMKGIVFILIIQGLQLIVFMIIGKMFLTKKIKSKVQLYKIEAISII